MDPLDHLARFERYLVSRSAEDLEACRALIRNELPHETWLEMAMFYVRLGLIDDAVAALKAAPVHPTILYWLAYLHRDSSPSESATWLEKASAMSPFLVFPFREEEIAVFSWATAARPADWKPKYYLALILWGKGRLEETGDLFEMCENADFAPFFIARGSFLEKNDPGRAYLDFRMAITLDARSWRARHILIAYHLRHGQKEDALAVAKQASADFPAEVPLQVDLAEALLAVGQPGEAAAVLDAVAALPYEGASDIHGLYVRANVAIGLAAMKKAAWGGAIEAFEKSKLYPEKLGTGAPFHPDFRMQDYLIALCLDKMGEKAKAADLRNAIREYTLAYWDEHQPHGYFGGLVLERLGKREDRLKARELLSRGRPSAEVLEFVRKIE
jgi:tetratricopeptide (TPR) repeat protein